MSANNRIEEQDSKFTDPKKAFDAWWNDVGSGLTPTKGDDQEQHARKVAEVAWMDAFVVITQKVNKGEVLVKRVDTMFDVHTDGKSTGPLGYDEMLGLVSSLLMPQSRPCLQWLKTPEQHKAWNESFNKTAQGLPK